MRALVHKYLSLNWKPNQPTIAQAFVSNKSLIHWSLVAVKLKNITGWHLCSFSFQALPRTFITVFCNSHAGSSSQEHRVLASTCNTAWCLDSSPPLPCLKHTFVFVFTVVKLSGLPLWCCRSLGPENLLLKGATLKNTQKICGKLNGSDFILGAFNVEGRSRSEKANPLSPSPVSKALQFTPAWRQRWLSTIRASHRSGLQLKSKLPANGVNERFTYWFLLPF